MKNRDTETLTKKLTEVRSEIQRLGVTVRSVSACPRAQLEAEDRVKDLELLAERIEQEIAKNDG